MVASIFIFYFWQSHIHNWLDLNQIIISRRLIDKVNIESQLLEGFRSVELAVQKNKDPFLRIRWLEFLNTEGESSPTPLMGMKNLFRLCIQHTDKVEAAFQDAIVRYKLLLQKYTKARKQYMNGVVSLHCEL